MKVFLMFIVLLTVGACTNVNHENKNQIEFNGVVLGVPGDTTSFKATIGEFEGKISKMLNENGKISKITFVSYNDNNSYYDIKFNQLKLAIENKYNIKLVLVNKNINMYSAVDNGVQFQLVYQFGNLLFTIDNKVANF